jgi:WD repeat-containing protein 22
MENTCRYLIDQESSWKKRKFRKFFSNRFLYANNLFFKDLKGHFSCINALEFSNKDQAHLITAGDDKRILVWSLHDDIFTTQPPHFSQMHSKHHSNVLTLSWDNDDQRVFSGGNDHQVIVHQVETYFQIHLNDICVHLFKNFILNS